MGHGATTRACSLPTPPITTVEVLGAEGSQRR